MIKMLTTAVTLLISSAVLAETADGQQTYDLLFKNGTLDEIDRTAELVYRREVSNSLKPEAAQRDTGDVALSFKTEAAELASLEFRQDGKSRGLGNFPASVGNPMIMYFYETVVRDMAESAGGSPFYIRNRVKESLIQPSTIETGEAVVGGETVPTQIVRLYPFKDDPNKNRMQGFGDLELQVTVSDEVPGWYVSLIANTGTKDVKDSGVYRSGLFFDRLGDAE